MNIVDSTIALVFTGNWY